jgi:serine/threonine protein kinase/tetratricopeptide (TPR) repeat protein
MIARDWQRVEALLDEVLELSPAERPGFLNKACADDNGIRAEVESLLACEPEAEEFLRNPALSFSEGLIDSETSDELAGQQIGPYRIVRELGRGGMGDVYLASRADDQYEKEVAIKLVKRGFGTDDIRRRFRHERQILATLDHPNIARLIDGGTTETGLPYFVMEYVDGIALNRYCDERKLNITERLKLFRTVCSAVQYAHQHLVIHRDLKPGNILVTAEGAPKLLDFGIAKVLDPDQSQTSGHTVTELKVMTPEYASPEQVRGEQVTTATDTYSLGVLLYELLTGHRPYRIKSRRPDEVARVICEEEPERPSTAISRVEEEVKSNGASAGAITPESVSTARNEQPEKLRRLLSGDLDNIVLMAMRKEPERRYASVEQFSEDIRRHLEGLPVVAHKDTFSYRTAKFVRRHKASAAAAGFIVLTFVIGVAAIAWEARTARRERDKAQYINTFLQDMLGAAAPDARGTDVKVIDVLNEASKRAKIELADKPEVMADVLLTLGRTYIGLGQYDKAEADLRAAVDASLRANGELHATTATSMGWLGLALAEQGKLTDGEQISRRAVDLQRKLHPQGNEDLGVALYALGYNLISKGEPKAAQPFLQEAAGLIKKHLGETNGYYMTSLVMLGSAHEKAGEVDMAEQLYRQAIDVGGRVEPRYRIYLAQAQLFLGSLLIQKAAYPEAELLLKQSETTYRDVFGGDTNYSVGVVKANLGLLYFLKGDYAKAEDEDRKALDLVRKYLGPESSLTVSTAATLGLTLTREGKATEGEPYLREALEIRKKALPPGDLYISITESSLGECLTAQKRYAEAEPLLIQSYDVMKQTQGEQNPRTLEARERLVKLYASWGKSQLAARFGSASN